MQRVCFSLRLREERLAEYVERHKQVWPEMLDALRATGWKNYSLFLAPGGMLIGYLETDDFESALDRVKAFAENERWQAEMLPFFDSSAKADDEMKPLPEIFHLD